MKHIAALLAGLATALLHVPASRADTVASLLGNFTVNQFCELRVARTSLDVHFAVVYGQLPALRELHNADTNGDGITSQAERDAYAGTLAPGFAGALEVLVGRCQATASRDALDQQPADRAGRILAAGGRGGRGRQAVRSRG